LGAKKNDVVEASSPAVASAVAAVASAASIASVAAVASAVAIAALDNAFVGKGGVNGSQFF
jgi:hypothetical protein